LQNEKESARSCAEMAVRASSGEPREGPGTVRQIGRSLWRWAFVILGGVLAMRNSDAAGKTV
jgi:hypothetical protein